MRHARLYLLPLAPLALASPAYATTYLSVEQAQALMFPQTLLTADFQTLTDAQVSAVEKFAGSRVINREVRAWRAASGGWFIIDGVFGKHELIGYAIALDAKGAIRQVEILDYRESYGGEVRMPAWRRQFVGKDDTASLTLDDDIKNISGATLSCNHITEGIKRLMAIYALVLAPHHS
ncbi:MAG: FMN-binding protein [Stenotrophobium sp.]